MTKRSFEVGDLVRVREWDDMVQEYGCSNYDDGHYVIITPSQVSFVPDMQFMCGREFVIGAVSRTFHSWTRVYPTSDSDLYDYCRFYTIVTDMLEPVIYEDELNEDSFQDVLFMT